MPVTGGGRPTRVPNLREGGTRRGGEKNQGNPAVVPSSRRGKVLSVRRT